MNSKLGDWVVGIVCALLLLWLLTPSAPAAEWRHHYMVAQPAGVLEGGYLLFSLHDRQGNEQGMMLSIFQGERIRVWAVRPKCVVEGYNIHKVPEAALRKLVSYCKV